MLNTIASIIAHPKYNQLIQLTQQHLIINHQHYFLWHVLPTITAKHITKSIFIKQMNQLGLQLNKRPINNKENYQHQQNQKSLTFTVSNQQHISYLKSIQLIVKQKSMQRQRLDNKISNLSNKFHHIQSTAFNMMGELELIEEVSSLKEINRNIFLLNSEINLLVNSFNPKQMKNNEQDTFDLLKDQRIQPSRSHKFYSMQFLEGSQ